MLHQLSEGHIAPLAWLSGKPLVASSPFHNLWWYTDVVPASYRNRGDQGLNDYLDAMNASAVVAHESYWVKYFRERPEEYTERWSSGIFHIYSRVKYQPTYFVYGSGSIDLVDSNHLELTPSSPNVTIKFRYFPFLKSSTCELAEAPVDEALSLIQLRNCTPGTRVSIQSVNPLKRIFGGGSDA